MNSVSGWVHAWSEVSSKKTFFGHTRGGMDKTQTWYFQTEVMVRQEASLLKGSLQWMANIGPFFISNFHQSHTHKEAEYLFWTSWRSFVFLFLSSESCQAQSRLGLGLGLGVGVRYDIYTKSVNSKRGPPPPPPLHTLTQKTGQRQDDKARQDITRYDTAR